MGSAPDIVLTAAVLASLPVCFRWPWIGALVWCWLGFMNPHRLLHGFAYDFPFSKLVAAATLAGLAFTTERHRLPRTREVALLLAFWGITVLSTLCTAIHPTEAQEYLARVSKTFLMNVVVVAVLLQERRKLIALVWVLAGSLGFYALTGGMQALVSGGGEPLYGPPASQIYDNNALAASFVLLLPFLAFLHRQATRRWERAALAATFAAAVIALVATFSRAGLLGGLVVAVGLAWARYYRLLAVAVLAVALISVRWSLVTPPTPEAAAPAEQWVARMETMTTTTTMRTDGSTAKRLKSWYVAWKLGTDHPLLGVGFSPFSTDVYEHYIPGYSDYHVAHNIVLQVFAEHGVPGLLLYSALLACVFLTLRRVAMRARAAPEQQWLADLAAAVMVAMAAYGTVSMFHPFSYSDLLFQCVAMAILLDVLSRRAQHLAPALLFRRRRRPDREAAVPLSSREP